MRILLQRVKEAKVVIKDEQYCAIGEGAVIFVGITFGDSAEIAHSLARKVANLRLFPKNAKEWEESLLDSQREVLVVSQFTLYADCWKGKRPDFSNAAERVHAKIIYESFLGALTEILGPNRVKTGVFGAVMNVYLCNWGPVTFILSEKI